MSHFSDPWKPEVPLHEDEMDCADDEEREPPDCPANSEAASGADACEWSGPERPRLNFVRNFRM